MIWLLEELELPYEVKVYRRTKQYTAPKELLDVWPTGMSPVLEIYPEGSDKPIVLAESGHIIQYVIQHYDPKGKLVPDTPEGKQMADYYLHFAEGSLQPHLVSILVGHLALQRAPWPSSYLVKFIMSKINSEFYLKRLMTNLKFLDTQLGNKGGGYFVGDKLSGADIIMDFPINENLFSDMERVKMIGVNEDLSKALPNLYKWHLLTSKEPLRIKAEQEEKAKL